MEQNPSSESNSCSAGQDISRRLCYPNVYNRVYKKKKATGSHLEQHAF
jgi:hypothetical protein